MSKTDLYFKRLGGLKTYIEGKHCSTGGFTLRRYLAALVDYNRWVIERIKVGVQVDTGALRDSVLCTVVGNQTDVVIEKSELNDYWKYLCDPIPWGKIYGCAYFVLPDYWTKYSKVVVGRYDFGFGYWWEVFRDALEEDLADYFGIELGGFIGGFGVGVVVGGVR